MIKDDEALRLDVRALKISRKELSLFSGISYNSISHWLNGFAGFTEAKYIRMNDAVQVYKGKMSKREFESKYNRIQNIMV